MAAEAYLFESKHPSLRLGSPRLHDGVLERGMSRLSSTVVSYFCLFNRTTCMMITNRYHIYLARARPSLLHSTKRGERTPSFPMDGAD